MIRPFKDFVWSLTPPGKIEKRQEGYRIVFEALSEGLFTGHLDDVEEKKRLDRMDQLLKDISINAIQLRLDLENFRAGEKLFDSLMDGNKDEPS